MQTKTLTFCGLDGCAIFCHGQRYELEVAREDDGPGTVRVSLPHAPQHGPAKFSAQQPLFPAARPHPNGQQQVPPPCIRAGVTAQARKRCR